MRSVHLIGLGLILGTTALGAMLSVMAYRWQLEEFPEQSHLVAGVAQTAPASQEVSKGKTVFDQKCSSCHTVGGGKRSGPDLKGVTAQRPHDWLVEFIMAPDKVIASGDPIAKQLVEEYGMPMPNVGVSKAEAEAVLAYLQSASGDSAAPASGAAAAAPPKQPPAATVAPAAPAAAPAAKPAAAAPSQQDSSRGQTLYSQKCASCHSLGGGRLAGPDLKGISAQRDRDWLIRFIVEPDKLIASGDPTAAQLVKEYGMPMPNLGVSRADAETILSYIDAQSGGAPPGQPAAAPPVAAAPVALGNAASGRALFTGERPMANGGPACMACHNAAGSGALGGGNWGLDLTRAQTKTGTAGLVSIMKSPPFPGMAEAYASNPVTEGEIADLAAFLVEVDSQQAGTAPDFAFPLVGLIALAALAGLTQLAWRGRAQGVRRQLVEGGRR